MKARDSTVLVRLAPAKKTASLKEIQALLKYDGPKVAVSDLRRTNYKGEALQAQTRMMAQEKSPQVGLACTA